MKKTTKLLSLMLSVLLLLSCLAIPAFAESSPYVPTPIKISKSDCTLLAQLQPTLSEDGTPQELAITNCTDTADNGYMMFYCTEGLGYTDGKNIGILNANDILKAVNLKPSFFSYIEEDSVCAMYDNTFYFYIYTAVDGMDGFQTVSISTTDFVNYKLLSNRQDFYITGLFKNQDTFFISVLPSDTVLMKDVTAGYKILMGYETKDFNTITPVSIQITQSAVSMYNSVKEYSDDVELYDYVGIYPFILSYNKNGITYAMSMSAANYMNVGELYYHSDLNFRNVRELYNSDANESYILPAVTPGYFAFLESSYASDLYVETKVVLVPDGKDSKEIFKISYKSAAVSVILSGPNEKTSGLLYVYPIIQYVNDNNEVTSNVMYKIDQNGNEICKYSLDTDGLIAGGAAGKSYTYYQTENGVIIANDMTSNNCYQIDVDFLSQAQGIVGCADGILIAADDSIYYAPIEKIIEKNASQEFKKGDANFDGLVTAADARIALQASAKMITLTEKQMSVADVNGDGNITASDARSILRVAAKLDSFD